ncbi:uncharacterized protein LOC117639495 isoform X2 [Thrips palmi]|uniref:Uncharacterized protein LOC117639495 isoform X2 n=1 Tax=Thrips palmi TaxID=161013 RepID=A0A6P8XVT4_THRPL|nr:uncharacterized protein LOC117639495 isoform X2 [Thrips palmi]
MWFYSNGSQAVFTDMGDAGVQRWLDTAKDQLGQPTCGNINLCEPLTALAALPGHMPWNVAVADGEGYVAGAGLLVHPKAVLTSSVVLQAATGWDDKSLFPAEDSANIVVLFTEPNGTSRNASVVRVSVQQTSKDRGSSSRNVVLLELAAEDAVFSTPVCLDLTGKVLQQLSPGQLGLVESWSEWQPANHSLIGAPFVSSADCYRRTTYKRNLLSKEVFCSEAMKGTIGPMTRGGGYVVSTGSQWFLQGLYLEHLAVRRTDLMVAKDLRDEEVRTWLQRELHKVETLEEYRLIDTGPKTCEGGRPSVSQCGKFASVDENTEDAGFDILGRATFDHMQWNVKVDVDYGVEGWSVRGGALVKRNMVLTSAHRLVLAAGSNTTVRLIPTSDLVVYYTSIDIRDGLSAEVDRIHVKARPARRPVEFDLALLVLTTALDLTPVCLPAPGTLVGTMPRLAAGSVGLVEFSVHVRAHRNWLIPVYYLRSGGCKNRLNETNGTEDEFCAETTVMGLEADADIPVLGYGLSVRGVDGLWYLRSVLSGQSQLTVLSFINLDDPGVLQWLAAKTRDAISDDQDDEQAEELTAANATTTPNTSSTPTTSTPKSLPSTLGNSSSLKCGQTSLPLNQLTTAGQKLYGHIPWTVGVFRARAEGGPGVIVGVLVREDMVLTDGASLLVPGDGLNHTGDVQTVDVGQMFVAWVGPTGKRNFVLVAALHVYERDRRSSQTSGVGVALLVLKTPITNSVVPCLDWDGDAPALPAIATGAIGVVETWRGSFFTDRRVLVALSALGAADCRTRLAGRLPSKDSIAEDMFCTGDSSETIETGAPFLVQRGGSWFLRGIYSFPITRVANRALVFVDLNDASVRKWLREKIRTAHANSSDTTASIQDVVLNAYRGDNFNGYTHL